MGRGKRRDLHESKTVTRAWFAALEDTVARVDQWEKTFYKILHCRFLERAPESSAGVEGMYSLRSADGVQKLPENLSADVRKFAKTLRYVRACEPMWLTKDWMMKMAVAVYDKKGETLLYKYKSVDVNKYISFSRFVHLPESIKVD